MATAKTDLDLSGIKQIKTQISEGGQSETGSYHGSKAHGGAGAVPKDRERKIGHRRVDEKTGTVTYKKKTTSELQAAIQLGIGQSVGGLSSKPERDLLMQDFGVVQSVFFPSEGSNMSPAHHYSDFRFKTYAPLAFRYFRELFNIRPDDFMLSLCDDPMNELSNPGAGGSIFYTSADDEFIIKTAQHKEANFLQKLLPGYYMNLNQNPRTLLPKFYGLYCYQCGGKNIRFVVMNNILPSVVKLHEKYDLKGSTYKRKASKSERAKSSPTLKDLDFMETHPEGLMLEKDTFDALVKTIQRDCRVLESFKIMDYSLLVGIHNLDIAKREKLSAESGARFNESLGTSSGLSSSQGTSTSEAPEGKTNRVGLARGKSIRTKVTQYSTPMESIQADNRDMLEEFDDEDIPPGGIPAKNAKGDRLLIYLGIIDILQCYRFRKKFEHTLKSMITDGETVSVTRPSFYADRFQKFFTNTVFKKAPSRSRSDWMGIGNYVVKGALKHSPSKRKPGERGPRTQSMNEDHREQIPGTVGARPDILMGSSTPPPTFTEATSGSSGARPRDGSSPRPAIKSTESEIHRSERTGSYFQTITQQEEPGNRPGFTKIPRHSPLSVSESTPTYTEFTEGTPSYTASSPSCSSEVLDTTIPNLPHDSASGSVESSPSKTMVASSSTEASYYSALSHQENSVTTTTTMASRSEERYHGNSHSVSSSVLYNNGGNVTNASRSDTTNNQTSSVKQTIEIVGPDSDLNSSKGVSNSAVEQPPPPQQRASQNTSFSSQGTSVDEAYTESIVSSTTTEPSGVSEQSFSTDYSNNPTTNEQTVTVVTDTPHKVKEETPDTATSSSTRSPASGEKYEIEESTYL